MEMLIGYDWPGNVRQLEHMMERAVILNRSGTIDHFKFPADDLSGDPSGSFVLPPPGTTLQEALADHELVPLLEDSQGQRHARKQHHVQGEQGEDLFFSTHAALSLSFFEYSEYVEATATPGPPGLRMDALSVDVYARPPGLRNSTSCAPVKGQHVSVR